MKKLVLALLLTVVFAVPAFSQKMDMPMMEPQGGHGQMMEMGDMDMMGDMPGCALNMRIRWGLPMTR